MNKSFDDIKVGDQVMILERVGLGWAGHFNRTYFDEYFFIKITVEKVVKTQFTAGGVRFKKGGCGFGDNKYVAYKIGSTLGGYHQRKGKVPNECESLQMELYREKLKPLAGYSTRPDKYEISPLRSKNVDDALRAHELIEMAKLVISGVEKSNQSDSK